MTIIQLTRSATKLIEKNTHTRKEREKGDLVYDNTRRDLVGIRGAKLLRLDADSWPVADRIGDKELRSLLETKGVERVALADVYDEYSDFEYSRTNGGFKGAFIGVLSAEGALAVVRTDYFSEERVFVLTRTR